MLGFTKMIFSSVPLVAMATLNLIISSGFKSTLLNKIVPRHVRTRAFRVVLQTNRAMTIYEYKFCYINVTLTIQKQNYFAKKSHCTKTTTSKF